MKRVYDESSVLEIGARGRWKGEPFVLVGRTCVRSEDGALWHEHAMKFSGAVRWLSETAGAYTVFEERPLVPRWEDLRVGAALTSTWTVDERGVAERVADYGEVLHRGPRKYRYADLSSKEGASATIDFGGPDAATFVGERAKLAELGLSPRAGRPRFFPVAERARPRGIDLWLAVGDEGDLDGIRFSVIAILARSIRVEGKRYPWQEYLLHSPVEGLRWLVVADGHWNLVERVPSGLVAETDRAALFDGETWKPLSAGKARLDWVTGEVPWIVEAGSTAAVRDYVRAPRVLSCEETENERGWSVGTYLRPDAVARAFGKRALPKPIGRAPNQPRTSR